MHFSAVEWFGFNHRIKHSQVFTKTENGMTIKKQVYGSFNWWALLFTWFYALFSPRCRTQFFAIKAAVPFLAMVVVNMVAQLLFTENIALMINLLGDIWYGFMFETWFRNQLIENGYHPEKVK